jgi:hypothetical protein
MDCSTPPAQTSRPPDWARPRLWCIHWLGSPRPYRQRRKSFRKRNPPLEQGATRRRAPCQPVEVSGRFRLWFLRRQPERGPLPSSRRKHCLRSRHCRSAPPATSSVPKVLLDRSIRASNASSSNCLLRACIDRGLLQVSTHTTSVVDSFKSNSVPAVATLLARAHPKRSGERDLVPHLIPRWPILTKCEIKCGIKCPRKRAFRRTSRY